MKKEIHPAYHKVVFVEVSTGKEFVTRSTLTSERKREIDGEEIPEIRVEIKKEEAGGTLLGNFDGIHLVPGNGYLFGDDFEGDTLCRWSVN